MFNQHTWESISAFVSLTICLVVADTTTVDVSGFGSYGHDVSEVSIYAETFWAYMISLHDDGVAYALDTCVSYFFLANWKEADMCMECWEILQEKGKST